MYVLCSSTLIILCMCGVRVCMRVCVCACVYVRMYALHMHQCVNVNTYGDQAYVTHYNTHIHKLR